MERLLRFATPNQFDQAPQGTECIVRLEGECLLYRQTSTNEEEPRWECIDADYKDTACSSSPEDKQPR